MNVYGCSSFSLFLPFCVCVFTYCHYDEYTLSYRISLLCLFARVTTDQLDEPIGCSGSQPFRC